LGRLDLAGRGDGSGDGFDGVDLIAALEADPPATPRVVFASADWQNEEPDIKRMVQSGRFKLCFNRLTGEKELYDLAGDPEELRNLIGERPGLADELMEHLESLMTGGREGGRIAPRSQDEIEALKKLGYF
jgi:hypothetical protein